jgi:lysophospholipase L1-like esterase
MDLLLCVELEMHMIKKSIVGACLSICAIVITFVAGEGIYSISQGDRASISIFHTLKSELVSSEDTAIASSLITRSSTFEPLLETFKAEGVALGNSLYYELRTEHAKVNTVIDGCKAQKPNLDKEMTYLRAGLYEPFSLVTAFYDAKSDLSPAVREFVDRYGTRRIRHRTNERGERLTVPATESEIKVIVAGDSIANGGLVNDHETLASRLQALDLDRQYVNIGIGGADADEIACALERAAKRYQGQIRELIYVYCENDFKDDKPMGQPEDVVAWLSEYVRQQQIAKTTIVYAPYIYNIVPHLTRFRGYRGGRHPDHKDERQRLERLALEAGFEFADMAELALEEIDTHGSQFAALALFVDHVHWSPLGGQKMAEHLLTK